MSEPVIYGPTYSTYARTVRLALEEKGVPYRLEEVDFVADPNAHKTPEHLARCPFAKVPAFEHDGLTLYETSAIARYVDDAFDGPTLQPADVKQRARMNQIFGVVDSYAYPSMITGIFIPRAVVPMLGGESDEDTIAESMPLAKTSVEALDALAEGGDFLVGNAVSLADIHLTAVYDYISQTPEGEKLLKGAGKLQRWWKSFGGRPSVEKTRPQLG